MRDLRRLLYNGSMSCGNTVRLKQFLRLLLIFATVHFLMFMASICIGWSRSMRQFDAGKTCENSFDNALGYCASILSLPLRLLHLPHSPDYIEWLLTFSNSILWGIVFAIAVIALNQLVRGGKHDRQ